MEEFIKEIGDIGSREPSSNDRGKKMRDLLISAITSVPNIKIIERGETHGTIQFEASLKDLGLSFELLMNNQVEFFSDFMANFLGELLVRENINKFASVLTSLESDIYDNIVYEYEHRVFGMKLVKDKILWSFHISLLQKILTEDIKRQLKRI